jgi:hypothetical protein
LLARSFWRVDAQVLAGRRDEASTRFDRLLAVRDDVGLLSEDYDTGRRRLVGMFAGVLAGRAGQQHPPAVDAMIGGHGHDPDISSPTDRSMDTWHLPQPIADINLPRRPRRSGYT